MTNEETRLTDTCKDSTKAIANNHGFSQENVKMFQDAFSVFDRDHNGHITTHELGKVMVALGQRPSLQELEALVQDSGTINFNEFLQMMANKMSSDPETELQEVFNVFDTNSDGLIGTEELLDVLLRLGETIDKGEVDEMIREADSNGDGFMDFADFKAILIAK